MFWSCLVCFCFCFVSVFFFVLFCFCFWFCFGFCFGSGFFRDVSFRKYPDFRKFCLKFCDFRKFCHIQKNKKVYLSRKFSRISGNFDHSGWHLCFFFFGGGGACWLSPEKDISPNPSEIQQLIMLGNEKSGPYV